MDNLENELKKTLKNEIGFDPEQSGIKTKETMQVYNKTMKKYKIEFWLRYAAAIAITIYGVIGIKYNTGRYITWALFTALVGFNSMIMLMLWYQHRVVRLETLKEMRQLQLQIAELAGEKSKTED
jgi:hypothetical protein